MYVRWKNKNFGIVPQRICNQQGCIKPFLLHSGEKYSTVPACFCNSLHKIHSCEASMKFYVLVVHREYLAYLWHPGDGMHLIIIQPSEDQRRKSP